MSSLNKKVLVSLITVFIMVTSMAAMAYSEGLKVGYVDLRKAFYEYKKTKTMEDELNKLAEDIQGKRDKKIEELTKLRDKAELMDGDKRARQEQIINEKLQELQAFDQDTRQDLFNKKNDMFRTVIDEIQKVVENMAKSGNYDYVLDSRNVMFAQEKYDLTDEVIKTINK